MEFEKYLFKILQKYYSNFHKKTPSSWSLKETDPKKASDIVYDLLMRDKPCMIARFGAFELATVVNYLGVLKGKPSLIKYIKGEASDWWWNEKLIQYMFTNAGFFPATHESVERYCKLMLEDAMELDALESWQQSELLLSEYLKHSIIITAEIAGPFFIKEPWTRALKGKKVLVVHPFAESIQKQFERREKLFEDPDILPPCELITIKAVQSVQGSNEFKDWFEALDFMKAKINSVDFDICIIGCGAYGFPLAAHVKRIGKKAIHLAGMTQLLFGIWGARWNKENYSKYNYKALLNPYWIRPNENETPLTAKSVEGGCYW